MPLSHMYDTGTPTKAISGIIAQLCTRSNRLCIFRIETGKMRPAQCDLSSSQAPGLGWHQSAGIHLLRMMRAAVRLRMSIMPVLIAQAICMAGRTLRIIHRAISPLSIGSWTMSLQPACLFSHTHQDFALDQSAHQAVDFEQASCDLESRLSEAMLMSFSLAWAR